MKGECEVFCVKLILWSIVAQKGTDILIFRIFEYGAESGAECSAESGVSSESVFHVITSLTTPDFSLRMKYFFVNYFFLYKLKTSLEACFL